MKFANPLHYPIAVLVGAIVLIGGVRFLGFPSLIMLPAAAAVATGGAAVLKSREPEILELDNPALERELQAVRQQSRSLVEKSTALRTEAAKLLTDAGQMDLLVSVETACNLTAELPSKIDQLGRRLQGGDSLLAVSDLQQQLAEVQSRLQGSSGVAQEQLSKLAESLERNIQLARQGEDARQAQVLSLSTLILDSAGVLQELQNKLRTLNLNNSEQMQELRSLSQELSSAQSNVDILVSR